MTTTTTEQKSISWTRGENLGSGAFGAVHVAQVTYVDTGLSALMAVKSAEAEHASSLKKEKEWMVGSNFGDCPHLLHCLGDDYTQENGKELYNVLIDYCPGGSIADLIKRTLDMDEAVSEETASRYAKSVLLGLKFLHESDIIHRDIKPSNLLLDDKGDVKIADFGLAKWWTKESESKRCKSRKGTINYMAPESVKEKIYGKGVDIWALGCTVVELIVGVPLFVGEEDEIMSELRKLHGLPNVDPCAEMTNTAVDFLKKCMYVDPTERWTAQMLLKHPFITGREEDPSSCPAEDDIMAINSPLREIVDFLLADSEEEEEDTKSSSLCLTEYDIMDARLREMVDLLLE